MSADATFVLQDTRRAAGLTQGELAERAHVTQSSISRWETGEVLITAHELDRLLRVMGRRLEMEARVL